MKIIGKTERLSKEEYFKKHLSIINGVLPKSMTPKEIEIMAAFISLEGDLAKKPFSTTGRKIVMEKTGIKFAGGLGNHLRELKNKGFILVDDNDELYILPTLIPEKDWQGYQFKIIME